MVSPAFRIGIVLFLFSLVPSLVWAAGARIEKLQVEIIDQEIRGSFELARGFNRKIERDIHDGIEKDFYFYILLSRKHEHWFDEEIVSSTIRYTVKYDTLKRIYTVHRQEGSDLAERTFDSFPLMQAFVSRVERVFVAPLSILKPNRRYVLLVKAQMKVSRVPLHLDRFLFFIPFLDLDTPWRQSWSIYATEGTDP